MSDSDDFGSVAKMHESELDITPALVSRLGPSRPDHVGIQSRQSSGPNRLGHEGHPIGPSADDRSSDLALDGGDEPLRPPLVRWMVRRVGDNDCLRAGSLQTKPRETQDGAKRCNRHRAGR
jgi:hypothetical protein